MDFLPESGKDFCSQVWLRLEMPGGKPEDICGVPGCL